VRVVACRVDRGLSMQPYSDWSASLVSRNPGHYDSRGQEARSGIDGGLSSSAAWPCPSKSQTRR
jgi:hypothetical protein